MEHIDGHPVVNHRVRFTDRTDISDSDAEHVKDGHTVVWIVQAVCQPPSYHTAGKDTGDRYRFNIQKVERAAVLTGAQRESALAYLDDPAQGYLAFDAPRHEPEPELPFEWDDDEEEEPAAVAEIHSFTSDEPVAHLFDDGETRVVGSIYAPGHESPTQKLLREAWGNG